MDIWKNIPGNNVYQLKQDPRFPDKPDSSSIMPYMGSPVDSMDNYGLRLTAYYKVQLKNILQILQKLEFTHANLLL